MKCKSHAKCTLCGGNSNLQTFDVKGYNNIKVEWECPFCGAKFDTNIFKYEVDRQKGEIILRGISSATGLRYSIRDDPGKSTLDNVNPSKREKNE